MRSVEIRVFRRDLRDRMAAMRLWLDEHRFEPSTFNCREAEDGVLIRVEFKVTAEAEAFAAHFEGRLDRSRGAAGGADPGILASLPRGLVG